MNDHKTKEKTYITKTNVKMPKIAKLYREISDNKMMKMENRWEMGK